MEGLGFIIGAIIAGLIWGFVCSAIGKQKNINGFWWGFFLGLIGVIVVACLPAKEVEPTTSYVVQNQEKEIESSNKYEKIEKLAELKEKGAITEEEFEQEKSKLLK